MAMEAGSAPKPILTCRRIKQNSIKANEHRVSSSLWRGLRKRNQSSHLSINDNSLLFIQLLNPRIKNDLKLFTSSSNAITTS